MKVENLTDPNRTDNPINGDYLKYTYDNGSTEKKYYWEPIAEDKNFVEREWRDSELQATDYIVAVTDHPNHSKYITYRQELRDYPAQLDFPNGERPIKP